MYGFAGFKAEGSGFAEEEFTCNANFAFTCYETVGNE